ncbi:relaxase/mobilization nuclease domain-containing protein [Sphingobacterium rhinopitheci]|uniref:relaxase/mobilization nuclease domain-containing protein n=1 Tax=Sphingobacterium rhinopitheci TaxID=2781960 RepID=UPI001F51B7A5|nr:relaxase/mobilization nuclease domain-containing protein [Sphingobacterium rhinopitheci]MCI0922776.1 relaxase/mobilization nuclease domain-containing protein [Sphingobacterium rhinopitheci]
MPIANANTGNGFSKGVSYALQEQKQLSEDQRAVVLEYNNVFGTSRDIGRQMRDIADDRERVQKPVLHLQINFHPDEKLGREKAKKAVHAILQEVGISSDNHQYVLVQHRDKAHDHYHVVANRVGMDGSLVSNERIIERLQVACDKVEQEQGLRRTEGRTVFYDPSQEKGFRYATSEEKKAHRAKNKKTNLDKNPNKREQQAVIKNEVIKVLQDKKISTADAFKKALESRGIDVRFMENKYGISGISFKTDKISVKGSQIGAKWNDISKILEHNSKTIQETKRITRAEVEKHLREDLQIAVSRCMSVGYGANIDHILKLRGLERTPQGYSYQVNDVPLLISSDLEKGIRDTIYEVMSLQDLYEKRKAYEEKIRRAKPMEIKKVPLFFSKEIKEANAKAEAYNKRLEQEKQKIAQNPVKERTKVCKQLLDNYIDKALKSKITIDNRVQTQEKERNRLEQMKVTKEENQEQIQKRDRSRGYRR